MAERVEQVQGAFTAYAVERELGSGGMATVYLVHDNKHDRKVAIKILHGDLAAVLGAERFLHEIRVTATLQHPHILGLIDSGIIDEDAGELKGRPYYVMPYLEGESLRQRLDKEQQLPVSDSVRIATEVASALDYAHRHSVIHRDIKPENILLHDGSAIVADFGIALAVTVAGGRMTRTSLALGTDNYMSPARESSQDCQLRESVDSPMPFFRPLP
jgi:serine/threonine-protein kinase